MNFSFVIMSWWTKEKPMWCASI